MKYAWMQAHRNAYQVGMMSALLEVSGSGFYAWRLRSKKPGKRAGEQDEVLEAIRRGQIKHRGCYGRRRMTTEVSEALGRVVNEKCVGRLMSEHDLQSQKRRQFRVVTTDSKHQHSIAPNVLERDFTASAPNQKWLADLTYVPTLEGWLYLALVLDLYARKLVGWAMSETMPQALTLEALRVALGLRNPGEGLTHHSDRGSQYAANDYRQVLKARGITVSMSGKGDCWDNAPMESVNGTLKVECVHGETFATREQARQAIVRYIGYYNTERRHSALGNVAPAWFEQQWMKTTRIAAEVNG